MLVLCLLPQQMFASNPEVTISGNKVTVTSTSAGSLATYVNSLTTEQKNALKVDEIVFVGKFNQSDFEALQGFPYKTVDMGEAKMVAASQTSANYSFYHDATPPSGQDGAKCVVGATKYVSQSNAQWTEVSNPGSVTFQDSNGWTTENVNSPEHQQQYNVGDYVKIASTFDYWRKDNKWEEISDVKFPLIYEATNNDNAVWYAWTWRNGSEGKWVKLPCTSNDLESNVNFVRMNPKASEVPSWGAKWNQTADLTVENGKVFVTTGYDNGRITGNWKEFGDNESWTVDGLKAQKANNTDDIVKINDNGTDKFYRYAGMKWTSIDESTALTESVANSKTIENPNWTDFDGTNHINDGGDPLLYVRFAKGYTYYQKVAGSIEWVPSTYNDGDNSNIYYPDAATMPAPTEAYQQAYAGGTEYEYKDNSWVPTGSSDNDTYDYSQMKFSYWSSTLEKAVTSKYADATISSEIFQNCKSLTEVDYKAGNVTGFNDHKTTDGYASNLKVTIGKNVTSIDASAFAKCTALQTLEFDKDYSNSNTDKLADTTYPLELTIGENAFMECANLTGVEFPNRVVSIGNSAFKEAGTAASEMTVSFERRTTDKGASIDFDRNLTIGAAAFQNCTTLKEVELPIRLSSLGNDAFKGTTNLTSATIREDIEDARLTKIPTGAFEESGIIKLTVPRSVTEIETHAFGSCYALEEVRFQEQVAHDPQQPLIIRHEAFAGGNEDRFSLKNVYVEIDPEDRLLVCEYNAFQFKALVGQTDVASEQIATLHFPEEHWDYYAGDWKKGLAFSQTNLNSFKDGYNQQIAGQQPTAETNGLVNGLQPANGWQQFAKSNTGIEIELPKGKFVRSYSVSKPCEIPRFANTERTPFVRIYRVTAFSDGWNVGDAIDDKAKATAADRIATPTEVTGYIPMKTGLLMVGLGEANQSYLLYPNYLNEEAFPQKYEWCESGENANLLQPTCDEEVTINPTIPYPFGNKNNIQYRIFGFKANATADGGVFLRSQPGVKMKPNQAYLQLPVSMFHWGNESGDNESGLGDDQGAKNITLTFDLSSSETDGISTMQTAPANEANESCYTLQGVKVERPTAKGIYIYKGKKIMVK